MPSYPLLVVFLPTFLLVSATPGMCMTLAMTLGMSIGVRKTLWMMAGELVGVAIVAVASATGVAALMLQHPDIFHYGKILGGGYLIWLGIQMWRSQLTLASAQLQPNLQPRALLWQGFITAIANPKGWAFMISLLPPFIEADKPLAVQLLALVGIILVTEFSCLLIYASGGQGLSLFLRRGNRLHWLNRLCSLLMLVLGGWLILE